jgi:gamma-glutamylcyclotransferase (GGCT)/AIG2-like uncharacterized protein YtfP
MNKQLVFVYGTLRSGSVGAMSIRFPNSEFVANAKVSGSLYDLGAYPGLLLNESSSLVTGEVYEVDDETLHKLDEFESTSNYVRKQVEISLDAHRRTCWTYEPDPEFYSLSKIITSGDWIEYARTKAESAASCPRFVEVSVDARPGSSARLLGPDGPRQIIRPPD